jgi:hypothetical protein
MYTPLPFFSFHKRVNRDTIEIARVSLSQAWHEERFSTLVEAKTPNEIIIVTVATLVER